MKMTCTHLIILLVVACIVMPVMAAEGNTTNTTVPTTTETTVVTTETTLPPTTTTATTVATTVTTAVPTATTAVPTTTATTVPATTAVITTQTTATTGDVFVASSPTGAAILIDGIYQGTTPGNVKELAPGNHLIRLSLSGYIDYEGTIYVIAGQSTSEYGTLHPMNTGPSQIIVATASAPATTAVPVTIVQPVATEPSSSTPLENPTVIAALIGIVTAAIGAGASIFTHKAKVSEMKKEDEPKKE